MDIGTFSLCCFAVKPTFFQASMDNGYRNFNSTATGQEPIGVLFQNSIGEYALRFRYGLLGGSTTDFVQSNIISSDFAYGQVKVDRVATQLEIEATL